MSFVLFPSSATSSDYSPPTLLRWWDERWSQRNVKIIFPPPFHSSYFFFRWFSDDFIALVHVHINSSNKNSCTLCWIPIFARRRCCWGTTGRSEEKWINIFPYLYSYASCYIPYIVCDNMFSCWTVVWARAWAGKEGGGSDTSVGSLLWTRKLKSLFMCHLAEGLMLPFLVCMWVTCGWQAPEYKQYECFEYIIGFVAASAPSPCYDIEREHSLCLFVQIWCVRDAPVFNIIFNTSRKSTAITSQEQ